MSRISIIYIGIALLVVGYIGSSLFPYPHGSWTQIFSSLPGIGMIFIAAGLLVRLFSPSSQKNNTAGLSVASGVSNIEKDFRYWRNALIAGFVFWFIALLPTFMAFDSGPSFWAYALLYSHLLALPLAITCLVVAYNKRKTNIERSVFFLKLPFYYAVGMLVVVFGSSILGLGL